MNPLMLMTGVDIPFPEIQTAVHQPTILEISYIGELNYFAGLQLLCIDKNTLVLSSPEDNSRLGSMSNFQIFMTMMTEQQPGMEDKKAQVIQVFELLFPGYRVQFTPRCLFFNNGQGSSFTLDEVTFEKFQEILKPQVSMFKGADGGYNPVGKKAQEIANKLMKGKQKIAELKGETRNQGGILSRYVSILTIGLNTMSFQDCLNLTVYQMFDLVERYGLYVSWDLDIKSRLAGGKPEDKPDDWMKNIH